MSCGALPPGHDDGTRAGAALPPVAGSIPAPAAWPDPRAARRCRRMGNAAPVRGGP